MGSEDDRSRPLLWTTTGPCSLQPAHHLGCAGAGVGSALTWLHWAAAMTRRPFLLRVTLVSQDYALGYSVGTDGECNLPSHNYGTIWIRRE